MSVAGYEYRIKPSASGSWGSAVDVGNVLTATINALSPETSYDVEIRSYDNNGSRSEWSSVVSASTGPGLPAEIIADFDVSTLDEGANNDPVDSITDTIGSVVAAGTTTTRPLLKKNRLGTASSIMHDGTDDFLDAGDNFDLLNKSRTVYIVAKKASGDGAFFGKTDGATQGSYAGIVFAAAPIDGCHAYLGGSNPQNNNTLLAGADSAFHLYEFRFWRDTPDGVGYVECWKDGLLIDTHDDFTTDESTSRNISDHYLIGKFNSGLPIPFNGEWVRHLIGEHNGILGIDTIDDIYTYIKQAYPSLTIFNPTTIVNCVGDSLTRGLPTYGTSAYPHKLAVAIGANSWREDTATTEYNWVVTPDATRTILVNNYGRDGEGFTGFNTDAAKLIDDRFKSNATNIMVFMGGTNNFLDTELSRETSLVAYFNARKAANPDLITVVCSVPDCNGYHTQATQYSTFIRTNWATFADHFVDINAVLPDYTDTSLFYTDGIHQTDAGRTAIKNAVAAVITPLL